MWCSRADGRHMHLSRWARGSRIFIHLLLLFLRFLFLFLLFFLIDKISILSLIYLLSGTRKNAAKKVCVQLLMRTQRACRTFGPEANADVDGRAARGCAPPQSPRSCPRDAALGPSRPSRPEGRPHAAACASQAGPTPPAGLAARAAPHAPPFTPPSPRSRRHHRGRSREGECPDGTGGRDLPRPSD